MPVQEQSLSTFVDRRIIRCDLVRDVNAAVGVHALMSRGCVHLESHNPDVCIVYYAHSYLRQEATYVLAFVSTTTHPELDEGNWIRKEWTRLVISMEFALARNVSVDIIQKHPTTKYQAEIIWQDTDIRLYNKWKAYDEREKILVYNLNSGRIENWGLEFL